MNSNRVEAKISNQKKCNKLPKRCWIAALDGQYHDPQFKPQQRALHSPIPPFFINVKLCEVIRVAVSVYCHGDLPIKIVTHTNKS
jgi:hypothetical protein